MKKIFTLLAVAAMAVVAKAQDPVVLCHYEAPDFENAVGVAVTGTTVKDKEVKYDANAIKINCIQLANGYSADGVYNTNSINLTTDGGFKAGDVVTVQGFINNSDAAKRATVVIFTLNDDKTTNEVHKFEDFINARTVAGVPEKQSYTLEADAPALYLGRDGGTGCDVMFIEVVRGAGGETPEPAEGETVEIVGSGSGIFNKVFDSIVIPFDFNLDTKELTLKDFLGGTTTVELKYNKNSSASGDNVPGTLYNAEAVSGLGKMEQMQGYYEVCPINGFTGDFVCKVDGADFCKLENIKVGVGFASTVQINEDPATHKKYCEVLVMLGGDYSKWDADKAEWVASGLNYVKIRKNVYFPEDPSSLEAVEAADENAPVEYYNLQGVRINEPAAGQIVIRRQGANVTKMVVR